MPEKLNILVLGGCGFVGRNFVHFLVKNDLATEVRVVDKTPPQMAWLNVAHTESFSNSIVSFHSANLIYAASCKTAFSPPKSGCWDLVINCAAETRPNQSEAVYKEGVFKLSVNCAIEAASINAKYVELSSGNLSSNKKTQMKEDDNIEPWTMLAKFKLEVEKELKAIPNLKFIILRLPVVYGIGDKRGLTPRILIASIYKYLNETMKLLWNEDMKINTVHVTDVVESIWELSQNESAYGQVINIVDDSESTQGSISGILADIFSVKVDYWGLTMSSMTKANMSEAVGEINDKHMGPWAEICQRDAIQNTPLNPYMDEELLYHKHLNLDNKKLKSFGYVLRIPILTKEKVREVIDDYVQQNLFPRSLLL
uniref:Putative c-3 sterol dehydrogenase/3-beta-hydroxysteroid dehydrogenase n=1 Tax=Tabanus bromius TaxID=304241 RepID=A0A0K8TLV2_TABBR